MDERSTSNQQDQPCHPGTQTRGSVDEDNGLSLLKLNGVACMNWLKTQENSSVVQVSFGSLAIIDVEQIEQLARVLNESGQPFLSVVRETGEETTAGAFDREQTVGQSDCEVGTPVGRAAKSD